MKTAELKPKANSKTRHEDKGTTVVYAETTTMIRGAIGCELETPDGDGVEWRDDMFARVGEFRSSNGTGPVDREILVRLYRVGDPDQTDEPDRKTDNQLVLPPGAARELAEMLLKITS